jgi:uncharacterized protein YeeX (DUF496 family)
MFSRRTFEIFGKKRRQVADYERRVKLLDNKQGFIRHYGGVEPVSA